MKDVAQHAGVSASTVSYVLNNSGPVAPDRRARVLDAVRMLGYAPNEAARGLKRRSAPTIGLVVPDLANQYFALLVQGVEAAATKRDALVMLCAGDEEGAATPVNSRLMQTQRLNGLIYLSGGFSSPAELLDLMRLGPVVLADENVPGFDLPSVVSDNRRGAREVAAHVVEAGHQRIAIIGGPEVLWTAQQRLAGYREALASGGIDPDSVPVFEGDYRQGSGTELAAKILGAPMAERPTALLCANDLMAVGVLEYCRDSGISVPDELSLVGFDDLPLVSLLTPRLTTVRQPAKDMGEQAANLLLDLIEGTEPSPPETLVAQPMYRESVVPPP